MRRARGFTQVELGIAIVVLAVGILGVFASFAYGVNSVRYGGRVTEASNYARQLVELVRTRNLPFAGACPPASTSGYNDPAGTRRDLNAAPFANDLPANTGFTRQIRIERVSNDPADYRYEIARITVTVYWYEKSKEKKVEVTALHRRP
jgi:type II secretory pathway pseudopilin PulG